jgi:hypothetical protein
MKKKILLGIAGLVSGLLLFLGANSLGDTLMGNTAQPVRVNYTSPISFVSPVKATTTNGGELFVNAGLETWTSSTQPADWTFTDFSAGGTGATITQSATTTGASSTSSARLLNNAGGDAFALLSQAFVCTPSSTYAIGGYFASDGASNVTIIASNDTYSSSTEIWKFASSTWIAFNPAGDNPETLNEAITDEFSLQGAIITCPASGVINFGVIPDVENPASAVLYADDFTAYEIISPAVVTLMDFTNPSDASRMTVNDTVFRFRTTGGTPYNWFYMGGLGSIQTDLNYFNFSKPVVVSTDYTYPASALNAYNGIKEFAEGEVIDMTTTTITPLFTVPVGYRFIVDNIKIYATEIENYSGLPTFGVGVTSDSNTGITGGAITPTGLQSATAFYTTDAALRGTATGNDPNNNVVNLEVTTAATADAYTVKVYVFGTLIAE